MVVNFPIDAVELVVEEVVVIHMFEILVPLLFLVDIHIFCLVFYNASNLVLLHHTFEKQKKEIIKRINIEDLEIS